MCKIAKKLLTNNKTGYILMCKIGIKNPISSIFVLKLLFEVLDFNLERWADF